MLFQSASQCIITQVIGFCIISTLIAHFLHILGSIRPDTILQMRTCQLNHNKFRTLLGPHLYTWVKSSNVDSVLLKDKGTGRCWESNRAPQSESRGFTPIYHSTSTSLGTHNDGGRALTFLYKRTFVLWSWSLRPSWYLLQYIQHTLCADHKRRILCKTLITFDIRQQIYTWKVTICD